MAAMVDIEHDGAVAILRLARPEKLNALTPQMLEDLETALARIETDAELRVIILAAAGERAFCVGADIEAWSQLEPRDMWRTWTARGHRVFERLSRLKQPVIALVQGYAFGGGLELALAADLRLGTESTQCAMPEVGIATLPGWGGTVRLPALIGPARAKQMIFSGERVDAAKALSWGLLNETVEAGDLERRGHELAAAIAAKAPLAVQLAKQVIDAAAGHGTAAALEGIAGGLSAASADAGEGIAAYRDKRIPRFEGR
jgi:enoyl-CoA hydratase